MLDVQRRAPSILWVHIPLLRRPGDFAAAFQTFDQQNFTSWGAVAVGRWTWKWSKSDGQATWVWLGVWLFSGVCHPHVQPR